MKNGTRSKRSRLQKWITAAFYIFGAFLLLTGTYLNPAGVSQVIDRAQGLYTSVGVEMLVFVSVLALLQAV